jgi:hypothetical protein
MSRPGVPVKRIRWLTGLLDLLDQQIEYWLLELGRDPSCRLGRHEGAHEFGDSSATYCARAACEQMLDCYDPFEPSVCVRPEEIEPCKAMVPVRDRHVRRVMELRDRHVSVLGQILDQLVPLANRSLDQIRGDAGLRAHYQQANRLIRGLSPVEGLDGFVDRLIDRMEAMRDEIHSYLDEADVDLMDGCDLFPQILSSLSGD